MVRNGISLMDNADHLLVKNEDPSNILKIAMDAGKRRMRPVFLTSVAAAAGVVPMILSGSPLWAPMGSVLAVGLIFGMMLTLIIVPVMYSFVNDSACFSDNGHGGTDPVHATGDDAA